MGNSVNVEMSLLLKVEEVASLKSEMRADVKEEVDKGLRHLPFEMVCAYKEHWHSRSDQLRPHHHGVQQLQPPRRIRRKDEHRDGRLHHRHQRLLHRHLQRHCRCSSWRIHFDVPPPQWGCSGGEHVSELNVCGNW